MKELEQYCRAKKRFKFKPKRSALIIVDAQQFFFNEKSHGYVQASNTILPNISWLVSLYREHHLPVIFTRHSLEENESPGIMGKWWGDVIRDSNPDSQVTFELQPRSEDIVIKKNRYSAFRNTGLADILREMKVTTVVIVGVLTHLCVESTARDAFMEDFETYIVIDATASDSEKLHMSALRTLSDGFAIPVVTGEIFTCFGGEKD